MNNSVLTHREVDQTFDSGGVTLFGTLCVPVDTVPSQLVVMITGSGEIDRNENAMQMQLNTFNAIAHALAAAGIASYRFDKRGCSMSGGKFHETGFYNFIDDAKACVNAAQTFDSVRNCKIFLMGHGEGALIAAHLCASNTAVQGQILLTPSLESMEVAVERQLQHTLDEVDQLEGARGFFMRLIIRLSGNQVNKQRKLMQRVKNTTKSSIKFKKTLINAKWLREIASVEPADIYSKVGIATLSIGAEKDLQSLPKDALNIENYVTGPVEAHSLSNLTHILRVDEGQPSTFKYKQLSALPIDSRISDIIVRWLQSC